MVHRMPGAIRAHPDMMRKAYLFILWLIKKRETYGYQIIKTLKQEGHPAVGLNRIYPMLSKMRREGLVKEKSRRRGKRICKIYSITKKGKETLEKEKKLFGGLVGEFLREMLS
ncbi:MAG: PadR family transcriptional regulator [Candidatus Micrarchaeota archaeon]|nr:PadR family transcriptional regulator [Candidatus Micrarchaeota archaeon]